VIMRANPPAGTGPELRLRSALHRAGLRFWKNHAISVEDVRTHPDVVFPRARVAVFVDGCFWHSCPEHGTLPRANAHYWGPKLARTVERDRRADRALSAAGWRVIRVWEHDPIAESVARVTTAVRPSGV
jgi:DNA mismatch endonuclease (patch repair protein)